MREKLDAHSALSVMQTVAPMTNEFFTRLAFLAQAKVAAYASGTRYTTRGTGALIAAKPPTHTVQRGDEPSLNRMSEHVAQSSPLLPPPFHGQERSGKHKSTPERDAT